MNSFRYLPLATSYELVQYIDEVTIYPKLYVMRMCVCVCVCVYV
jgi:hypothetical protein